VPQMALAVTLVRLFISIDKGLDDIGFFVVLSWLNNRELVSTVGYGDRTDSYSVYCLLGRICFCVLFCGGS